MFLACAVFPYVFQITTGGCKNSVGAGESVLEEEGCIAGFMLDGCHLDSSVFWMAVKDIACMAWQQVC